jgi:tetratricopeptide (TPR) repeat protein
MSNSLRSASAITVIITCALMAYGCGGGGNGPSGPTLTTAWEKFEAGLYEEAVDAFRSVLGKLSAADDLAEGYSGLGWSYAFSDELDSAASAFESALEKSGVADAAAGLAAVSLVLEDYESAISEANRALGIDPTWSFDHHSGIDHLDLRLILAQAYFALGPSSYENAQAQIDILSPENGLDPTDSGTWGGHPTYGAALLSTIQQLEETIGAGLTPRV